MQFLQDKRVINIKKKNVCVKKILYAWFAANIENLSVRCLFVSASYKNRRV